MGVKDITEKYLESYNDVFSDIVNVYFAVNGIRDLRIERPEDLQDAQMRTVYKSLGEIREQERDVTKLWTKGDTVISLILRWMIILKFCDEVGKELMKSAKS